ncbi:MAG: hypothetical protein M1833_001544 [Piccolia ochrophora]|nr:MAG: hypothetical protein M1833_001544 [Piccolia ochrophora]
MTSEYPTPSPDPPKFSRYRSVRRSSPNKPVQTAPMSPPTQASIARSMSRYRRTRPAASIPRSPPQEDDPFKTPPSSRNASEQHYFDVDSLQDTPLNLHRHRGSSASQGEAQRPDGADAVTTRRVCPGVTETITNQEEKGLEHVAGGGASAGQEHSRVISNNDEAVPDRTHHQRLKSPKNERSEEAPHRSTSSAVTGKGDPSEGRNVKLDERDAPTSAPNKQGKDFDSIAPGGGGVVPGTDAPISAVNAGERRVKVECNGSFINLPVVPGTTATDLVYAATNCLGHPSPPEKCLLLESFKQLGLERSLRKYEHVREVMNSWDRDAQNSLVLIVSTDVGQHEALQAKCVKKEQPGETSVHIYHSHKPGKWSKRWITLRSDGQMIASKKQGGYDKDSMNICHLSDFDVYSPTRRQLAKHLRPPKKQCFAVKSQQKSSMFLSTANFVHFFATDNKQLAETWHKAVQGWRSWYLVNMKGEGQEASTEAGAWDVPSVVRGLPYQIGSFQPFMTSEQLPESSHESKPLAAVRDPHTTKGTQTKELHARNLTSRAKKAPPVSFSHRLTKDRRGSIGEQPQDGPRLITGVSPQEIEDATFSPTGLLGRTYTHRQRSQREREMTANAGAFLMKGPSLLVTEGLRLSSPDKGVGLTHNASVRLSHTAAGVQRNPSQTQMPKPLLDFSNPDYREPPQHARKGRGIALDQRPAGGLVEAATSPEVAIPVPSSHVIRRNVHGEGGAGSPRKHKVARSQNGPRNPFLSDSEQEKDEDGFTGLLARQGDSWGGASQGRGVMTGDRQAREPMLNVSERSNFAPGSLLAHVEHETGSGGPVIDREERREVTVNVGEGL